MRRLESVISSYNDVDVWESPDGTIDFEVIGATHATWHPVRLLTGHAWDTLTAASLLHPDTPSSLLMLGLGGGTVLRQLRHFLPGLDMTAVEIDGEMIRLAREYMHLEESKVEVVHADAHAFVRDTPNRYDVVIDDLYRSGDRDVERSAAVDREMVDSLQRLLTPGGVLVMNFVVGKGHQKVYQKARKTLLETFPSVRGLRPPLSHNVALAGTHDPRGLRTRNSLKRFHASLTEPRDLQHWKELRVLKLP